MEKEIMDIEFNSVIELYNRVKPALRSKVKELEREKYDYIKEDDVWNFLVKNKWSKDSGLVLCDIVNDIIHADNKKIDKFVKEKIKNMKKELLFEELDLI